MRSPVTQMRTFLLLQVPAAVLQGREVRKVHVVFGAVRAKCAKVPGPHEAELQIICIALTLKMCSCQVHIFTALLPATGVPN